MQKTGWTKFLPIDIFNNAALKEQAQQFYNQLNTGLAAYVAHTHIFPSKSD
jgi:hypothetical protein